MTTQELEDYHRLLLEMERGWLKAQEFKVKIEIAANPNDILLLGKEECYKDLLIIIERQFEKLNSHK